MKPIQQNKKNFFKNKGSALLTVIMFIGIMLLLTGSMLKYTVNERRSNERNKLLLRSRNMAENTAIYASEQLTTKLRRLRSPSKIAFDTGSNQIYLPPDNVLKTENSEPADVEVKAGLTSSTGLKYIDPVIYPNDPNKGLQVDTATVQIIAKSTMRNVAVGEVTTYVQQDLAIDLTPLFQFGVFYNMDMEYGPGPDMTITGPVHTNGNLIARMQTGKSSTLEFADRVSAFGGFYANTAHKGSTWMNDDSEDAGPGGTGKLNFTKAGTTTTIEVKSGTTWRDHKWGGSTESATSLAKFESFASTYAGNLRTSVHGTSKLELPAVGSYNESTSSKAGREIVEEPYATDNIDLALTKISRNAGLYIVVNPDTKARSGKYPNGSSFTVLGRSYRCFLSYRDSGGTQQYTEVVLPGQPSYGYNTNGTPDVSDDTMYQNKLPNRYTDKTAIGSNQVLRIPASGKSYDDPISTTFAASGATTGYASGTPSYSNIPDAFFYDMRRATNNTGHPWNRPSKNYIVRPIAKIDFDLTRFRLAVERTLFGKTTSSSIYNVDILSSGNWSNSILNNAATTKTYALGVFKATNDYTRITADNTTSGYPYASDPFRIYTAPSNPADPKIETDPNGTYGLSISDFVNISSPSPWSDGISIYIHSVAAEDHTIDTTVTPNKPDRIDSGVRLWNGRGPIISLDASSYPKRTGFTLATNDAAYIVGHFNADGTINSTATDISPYGGYSARYPDSNKEMLAAVMADAITILSQPVFNSSLNQTSGWSDSLSAHRAYSSSSYSSDWATKNPSTSNPVDGISTSIKPASMPQYSNVIAHPGSGSNRDTKFTPTSTEVSSCLLTGIVRTTSKQTSGGVHNFPRLLEYWPDATLAIRGSMVALFESQVATEPWSIRAYNGAIRKWGLHQALRDANHDVPLEPIVIGAHRLRYLELSPADYQKIKDDINALPH